MHVNCADFVYKAIRELIQVLYLVTDQFCLTYIFIGLSVEKAHMIGRIQFWG